MSYAKNAIRTIGIARPRMRSAGYMAHAVSVRCTVKATPPPGVKE